MMSHCASCRKADAKFKACKACKLVKYCGVDCQVAHRPAHKKACREKAKELFDVQLFAQPKKREECPICMLMLPCRDDETAYMECCGKTICNGCRHCLTRNCCPFCNAVYREPEIINRLFERVEKYNDPEAMVVLGGCYNEGLRGLPVDKPKAFGLFRCASELGCAGGHYNLASAYELGNGTEVDRKKAVHHFQIAAMMGNMLARHNLGATEANNGNKQRAMKHFMIAAESGLEVSLDESTLSALKPSDCMFVLD